MVSSEAGLSAVAIVGPTAVGKSDVADRLAARLSSEVLSCDAMQIYRGMDIGTAKPTQQEMDGVVHHMIDCVDPREDFSVGRFVEQAEPILQEILAHGRTCVIAGGTGLYVDSLIQGRTFAPIPQTGRREALERRADYITHMVKEKHPYDRGVTARREIEF